MFEHPKFQSVTVIIVQNQIREQNLALSARADLVISEFSASNNSVLFDGLGNAGDWIELHNPSSADVALAGWKLRDSLTTWTFPPLTLPAGGYLIARGGPRRPRRGARATGCAYEIRFKDYLIIFKAYAQYIEILSIVNSHLFKSPNEAVLYERA